MCFGCLVKGLFHPKHSKRILMLNWRNQDFIPAFTQWTIVNKKTFYRVKVTSGSYFGLKSIQKKKHALCAKAVFVNKKRERERKTGSNMMFGKYCLLELIQVSGFECF